jgi:hypothetical protein
VSPPAFQVSVRGAGPPCAIYILSPTTFFGGEQKPVRCHLFLYAWPNKLPSILMTDRFGSSTPKVPFPLCFVPRPNPGRF